MTEKYKRWEGHEVNNGFWRIREGNRDIIQVRGGYGENTEYKTNLITTAVNACIEVAQKYDCDPLKVAEYIASSFNAAEDIYGEVIMKRILSDIREK